MSGRTVLAVAVLALVLAALSYWLFLVHPERIVERARIEAPETLLLSAMSGGVEIADANGVWRTARPGERLSARQRIRTDEDGEAELRAADGSTVRLSNATDARVDELRRELKRLSLATGQLTADVRDDPTRVFEVAVDDQGGVARTRNARFTASVDKNGAAVATHRGEVILSARGKEVVIRSGQFARLEPGGVPGAPEPLPQSLFLKVAWPKPLGNKKRVAVSGLTAPNARVKVDGHFVRVNADGTYRDELELEDGSHEIEVHASDLAGHVVDEKSPRIVVDTKTDFKVHPPKWE
jgi:hypothetical protein